MSVSVVLLGQPTYLNANDIGELLNPIFNVVVANMNVVRYAHAIVGGRKSASVEKLGQRCNSFVSHGGKAYLTHHILAFRVTQAPCRVCFVLKQYRTLPSGLPCDNQTSASASHIVQLADYARDKISLELVERPFTKYVAIRVGGKLFLFEIA